MPDKITPLPTSWTLTSSSSSLQDIMQTSLPSALVIPDLRSPTRSLSFVNSPKTEEEYKHQQAYLTSVRYNFIAHETNGLEPWRKTHG